MPPGTLKGCKELFDKNILLIKKLVKDTGDSNKIIYKEQNNYFCV